MTRKPHVENGAHNASTGIFHPETSPGIEPLEKPLARRQPRAKPSKPEPLPPLEVIARQLCVMPRMPYTTYVSSDGRVVFEGLFDTDSFLKAILALRIERCDKAKLDEALVLKRQIKEQQERLDELEELVPRELIHE